MRRVLALVTIAVACSSAARGSTWTIDPVHSNAEFAVRHMMVSKVRGHLGKVTGVLHLDDADPTKSSLQASIDATGIDTRESKRDQHLKSPDFLDVAKYPTLTFRSTQITKVNDRSFRVSGNLTIRGVTKPVTLNIDGAATPFKDPAGNLRLGGTASTQLDRKDFGMVWNKTLDGGGLLIGDTVDVTIDVELVKQATPG